MLVYEYVEGGSLQDRLANREGRKMLPWSQRVSIAYQVASALHYLHGLRVIHMDLKPANILLTGCCHVKLADFGLAKLLPGRADELSLSVTDTSAGGSMVGTLPYIDPQYIDDHKATEACDVYAFGACCSRIANPAENSY
ncbi:MAG: protein kinase [Pirellula sp.]|jgi:serine/threonine protein kinase|nr:protein kinase [Pirellula sp.]